MFGKWDSKCSLRKSKQESIPPSQGSVMFGECVISQGLPSLTFFFSERMWRLVPSEITRVSKVNMLVLLEMLIGNGKVVGMCVNVLY